MKKNYITGLPAKSEMPAQRQTKLPSGVSMETKVLLAKIGLLICIIILIVAKSFSH